MTFRFLIAEGFASLRRVLAASVIGAMLTGISLAIVGGLILVAVAYRAELNRARSSATVEVFLADEVDDARAEEIAASIHSFAEVASARVRSRRESAELFDISPEADTALIPDGIPLPITIRVELRDEWRDIRRMTEVGTKLQTLTGIEEVSLPSELLQIVEDRSALFVQIAIAVGIALSLCIIGVVANTAQLTVVSRRSVIRTMKLLGAERRWVIAPFIVQGFVIGMVGGGLAAAMIQGSWYIVPNPEEMLSQSPLRLFPLILPACGALLGTLGAATAGAYYAARQ